MSGHRFQKLSIDAGGVGGVDAPGQVQQPFPAELPTSVIGRFNGRVRIKHYQVPRRELDRKLVIVRAFDYAQGQIEKLKGETDEVK